MLQNKILKIILIVGGSLLLPCLANTCEAVTAWEIIYPTLDNDTTLEPDENEANYARVDENAIADSNTVWTTADSEVYDKYNFSDAIQADSGLVIEGVRLYAFAKYEVITPTPSGRIVLKINNNNNTYTLTTSWAWYFQEHTTNPATGNPWTWAEIDAMVAGVGLYNSGTGIGLMSCEIVFMLIKYTLPTGEILRPNTDDDVWLTPVGDTNNNYTNVDEAILDTGDYNYVATGGEQVYISDTYEMTNSVGRIETINSVTVVAYTMGGIDASITGNYIKLLVDVDGNEHLGSEQRTFHFYGYYAETWLYNPEEAPETAWTWGKIDDLLAGADLKHVVWAGWHTMYQHYVIVKYTERRIFLVN